MVSAAGPVRIALYSFVGSESNQYHVESSWRRVVAWPYPAFSQVARMKAGSVDSLLSSRSVKVWVRKWMRESAFSSGDGLGGSGT